jgi:putative flippase GtrA
MFTARPVREIVCFGLVGVTATLVHYLTAIVAVEFAHLSVYVANLLGYAAALGVSFFGHSKLTFKRRLSYYVFRRFLLVSLATFLGSELLLVGLEEYLQLSHRIAMVFVVLFVPPTSFILNKFWVYR